MGAIIEGALTPPLEGRVGESATTYSAFSRTLEGGYRGDFWDAHVGLIGTHGYYFEEREGYRRFLRRWDGGLLLGGRLRSADQIAHPFKPFVGAHATWGWSRRSDSESRREYLRRIP